MPQTRWSLFTLFAGILLFGNVAGMANPSEPATATDVVGYWQGAIVLPSGDLGISLTFASDENGWTALLDIPQQGIRRMELSSVGVKGNAVTCKMPSVPGDPTFLGHLTEDGTTISGEFVQTGEHFEFIVTRTEPPADAGVDIYADFVKPGVPGKGLIGKWRGLLKGGPMKYRMELSITVREGALIGVLTSIDQDGAAIPVTNAVLGNGKSVQFEIPQVGGSYEGMLSPNGAEMIGKWSQNGRQIQFDLHRTGELP